jgi:segregation and condensation protein B
MQEELKGYEQEKDSGSGESDLASHEADESRHEQIEDLNVPADNIQGGETEIMPEEEIPEESFDMGDETASDAARDGLIDYSEDGGTDADESDQPRTGGEAEPWSHGLDIDFGDDEYPRPEMVSVVEAVLFASDEPVTLQKLMSVADISLAVDARNAVDELNERYQRCNSAFRIEKIAGGYQMLTHPVYKHWLLKLVNVRSETKLTQAALETLAIVAYKQPVIRADVEAIRGVSSGEMIRSLMTKGLVKITGRAEVVGRPMLYGTTKKFLEVFGLSSIKDLPKVEDLKNPGV